MRCTLYVLTTLLMAVACDPKPSAKDEPPAGATRGSGALAARTEPAPGDEGAAPPPRFNSLSECLSSCERADAIPTNRETCRLNCDTAYGADAGGSRTAVADDAIGEAASCLGRCYAASGPQDECASGCKAAAARAPSSPAADVLDRLQACIGTCPVDNARPTNRETCELNCAQAARVAGTPPPSGSPPASR